MTFWTVFGNRIRHLRPWTSSINGYVNCWKTFPMLNVFGKIFGLNFEEGNDANLVKKLMEIKSYSPEQVAHFYAIREHRVMYLRPCW